MLHPFGQDLYYADGPTVPFMGIAYPTRMAIARLHDGRLWVWSPIALSEALADSVDVLGPVACIVSPNKLHHLALPAWHSRWPAARLYAPPGLARRRRDVRFDSELGDEPEAQWVADVDQAVFRGSFAMEEVVFFHRASRTAIVGDLIQRFPPASLSGWKAIVMRLDGLVGANGGTPRDWRLSFLSRKSARAARERVLGWKPERLLIAHGECASADATDILAAALRWI